MMNFRKSRTDHDADIKCLNGCYWTGAAIVASSLISANASKSAGNTQASAANSASQQQWDEFNIQNQQQQPWVQAGSTAIGDMANMTNPANSADPNNFTHKFTTADLNANLAPNYDFMLKQGQGQVRNADNASGGVMSGNTLQGLNSFTQNYAQNAYQQAYNNYNANQTNIFNRLSSIAGAGQTTAAGLGNLGMNTAATSGNYLTSGAAASAAGTVGAANAVNNGVNNAIGWNYLSTHS